MRNTTQTLALLNGNSALLDVLGLSRRQCNAVDTILLLVKVAPSLWEDANTLNILGLQIAGTQGSSSEFRSCESERWPDCNLLELV